MAEKKTGKTRLVLFLFILFLAAQACIPAASAGDADLLKMLPGSWTCTDEVQEADGKPRNLDVAFLTFGEDGKVSIRCTGKDGESAYSCEGTWSFELVPDAMDRLTLRFTSTDNPLRTGTEYSVECVYHVYAESWLENDTEYTYFILDEASCSGVSPFEELTGYGDAAIHREKGPNMRVVRCSQYVSLRAERSTSSRRLAKVPLGATVLAFPESGEENGFILCDYHDEYGYILAEYLQPIE